MVGHHQIVIIGGGTAGITVAASLRNHDHDDALDIAIIEPSKDHYYQPAFTLVGSGAETTFEQVLQDVSARDARDSSRATAPMVAAQDAVLIDTSELSLSAAIAQAIAAIDKDFPDENS